MTTKRVLLLARARTYASSGDGRRLRLAHCLSLHDLAETIGVTPGCLSRWERGDRMPRSEAGVRYAELLQELELLPTVEPPRVA